MKYKVTGIFDIFSWKNISKKTLFILVDNYWPHCVSKVDDRQGKNNSDEI